MHVHDTIQFQACVPAWRVHAHVSTRSATCDPQRIIHLTARKMCASNLILHAQIHMAQANIR
eukprot:3397637-Pleurochrysis_carterae.AAC.2